MNRAGRRGNRPCVTRSRSRSKELRSYFASPIGYIVHRVLRAAVRLFLRHDAQLLRPAEHADGAVRRRPEAMNVNQVMIRPLLQNVTILLLFLMPMVTMRSYSEEKRSGTIELLLTSPLTDWEIILGKFLGALALWAAALAVTLIHIALLFYFGNPGMEADRDRLSGPAADGRLLHLGGSADFEPHQQPDRRRHGDLRRVPVSLGHQLDRQLFGPDRRQASPVPLDHRPLRRLRERRHRHVTSHLLHELHQLRLVPDGQVGRQRTVARISHDQSNSQCRRLARRRAGVHRRGDPLRLPGAGTVRALSRLVRPRVRRRVHGRTVARDRRACSAAVRRATARWRASASWWCSASSIAVNYIGARQNKRWDLTANKAFSLSDQTRNVLDGARLRRCRSWCSSQEPDFARFKDRLQEYEYISKQVTTEYVDPDKKPAIARQNQVQQYGTIVFNYKGRTERRRSPGRRSRAGHHQRHHQGGQRPAEEGLLRRRATANATPRRRSATATAAIAAALGRENYVVDKLVLAQAGAVPDDAAVVIVAGPKTDFLPARDRGAQEVSRQGRQAAAGDRSAGQARRPAAHQPDRAGARMGHGRRQRRRRRRQRHGPSDRHRRDRLRSSPNTERIRSPSGFSFVTAFPLARSVTPVMDGVNGRTAQPFAANERRKAGPKRDIKDMMATGMTAARSSTSRKVDKKRAGDDCRSRFGAINPASDRARGRTARSGGAEAGNPGGGHRRFGFRGQCRPRHPGQPRSVHEHASGGCRSRRT